jgi:hypothetical protein
MGELITIGDDNWMDHDTHIGPDGLPRAKGLIFRDWRQHPQGCLAVAPSFDLDLIPESEWAARIADQEANQSSLQHIRDKGNNGAQIPTYDQDGKGYCWAHSSTSAVTLARAANNEPYVPLSAFAVACIIKGYRDQGGNGIDSLQFIADRGIPSAQFWPMQSMSSSNDKPETWANAALHKCIKFLDCSDDPQLRRQQVATASLLGLPVIADYNWWSHSVCLIRVMSPTTTRIFNSWGDSWSQQGVGDLTGSKAWPDDAWVVVTEAASQT